MNFKNNFLSKIYVIGMRGGEDNALSNIPFLSVRLVNAFY